MGKSAILAAMLLASCATAREPLADGSYCVKEALVGNTGRETFPLGDFLTKLDVARQQGRTAVAFWNAMPDSQQILSGEAEARLDGTTLVFDFEDGWGNAGRGRVGPDGTVTLTPTRPSADPLGSNILRNYGTFKLSREACGEIQNMGEGPQ